MCTTKQPKPQATPQDEKKPVQYLSSPWVDGLGIVGAQSRGRNSLRIDPGSARRPVGVDPGLPLPPAVGPRPTTVPYSGRNGLGGLIGEAVGNVSLKRAQKDWDAKYSA